MPTIKAQKIPVRKIKIEDEIARFCYHFPQYTFSQARKLPGKRIAQMLRIATQEQAKLLYSHTQIAAAPHSKKGKSVGKILSHFEGIIKG